MKNEKAKHTPGPWRVCKNNDGVLVWQVGSNFTIAKVTSMPFEPSMNICEKAHETKTCSERGAANAALISAAPELLAALAMALAAEQSLAPAIPRGERIEIMRAAIAKATGK